MRLSGILKRLVNTLLAAIIILVIMVCAAYFYARYVEPARITLKCVEVEIDALPSPVKIVAIADLHVGIGGMDAERLRKIMTAIIAEQPDIVVFLGDLFENYRRYSRGEEQNIARALDLAELSGVARYAVMGNHDQGGGAEKAFREIFELVGWTVLINENAEHMGINIIGSDSVTFGKPDVGGLISRDTPNLLLIHEPDYGDSLSGIDLQLSGHTHGGQVCLPFFGALTLPAWGEKYVAGLYTKPDGGLIYVSRGMGMSGLPFRFFSPPEIAVLTLIPPKNGEK